MAAMTFRRGGDALTLDGTAACILYAAIHTGKRGVYLNLTFSDALAELHALGFRFEPAGPSYPGGPCRFRLRRSCRGWELHRPWVNEPWYWAAV
ncbi:hypothetical protein CU669_20380 [Paramagnetospirillum kuznetsovii]|uniref:Uncharacterized protein n=1 Tax=Paramagnetospirillum kuznetsovii TaxID=2053833 RepID=A0A364NT28_9PROT|nr:hypothetical protein [Paramagnetospirillum kuznetsovii]RAU20065.1 hypothetical protein CU669_20380 [Paramagnetospirillum kuznetsovii]